MSKQRHNQKIDAEFVGMKGWERQYLKKSISYGHLDAPKGTKKQHNRYKESK